MRAVSEDKDTAALMGINVDRTISTTFAIGGLLAGAAGVLYALVFGQVHWFMGFLPGIKAFTAAVLGGIGNIVGAMLGGLTLGLLEQVGPNLLPGRARRAIAKSAAGRHRVQRARPGPDLPAIRHPREAGEPLRCGSILRASQQRRARPDCRHHPHLPVPRRHRRARSRIGTSSRTSFTLGRDHARAPALIVGYVAARAGLQHRARSPEGSSREGWRAPSAGPCRPLPALRVGGRSSATSSFASRPTSSTSSPSARTRRRRAPERRLRRRLWLTAAGVRVASPRWRRPVIAGALGVVVAEHAGALPPSAPAGVRARRGGQVSSTSTTAYDCLGDRRSSSSSRPRRSCGARPRGPVARRLERTDASTRVDAPVDRRAGRDPLPPLPAPASRSPAEPGPRAGRALRSPGLGLNIVVGYAGLLDLGYVAFYAVGAYLTALLTSPSSSLGWGLPFWLALPIVVGRDRGHRAADRRPGASPSR